MGQAGHLKAEPLVLLLFALPVLMVMLVGVNPDDRRLISREDETLLVVFLLFLLGVHAAVNVPMVFLTLVVIMFRAKRIPMFVQEDLHLEGVPFLQVDNPILFRLKLVVYLFLINEEEEPSYALMGVLVLQVEGFTFRAAEQKGCREDRNRCGGSMECHFVNLLC